MKNIAFRGVFIFFILFVATSVMVDVFNTEFGRVEFSQKHGIIFLFFITIVPRLTLLISSVATGGIFWWLGFFFCPRILVASLATVSYFHTNPILVTISWIIALGGETMEKFGLGTKKRFFFRTFRAAHRPDFQDEGKPHHTTIEKNDVIEAEFIKKS